MNNTAQCVLRAFPACLHINSTKTPARYAQSFCYLFICLLLLSTISFISNRSVHIYNHGLFKIIYEVIRNNAIIF